MFRSPVNSTTTPASSSRRAILDPQPSAPLSPTSRPTTGPEIVKLEDWHFDYFLTKEEAASLSGRAMGRTLITADGMPLGFGGCYFDKNDKDETVVIAFFYGGPGQVFMRKYMTMVLRTLKEVAQILIEMSVATVYCVCDRSVPGSETFIRWCKGERLETEEEDPNGPIYAIKLENLPVIAR